MSIRAAIGRLAAWLGLEVAGFAAIVLQTGPTSPLHEPIDAAAAAARWVALVLVLYLAVVTIVQLVALALTGLARSGVVRAMDPGARLAHLSAKLGPRGLAGLAAAATVVAAASACTPAMATSAQHGVGDRSPVVMVVEEAPDDPGAGPEDAAVTMEVEPGPGRAADAVPAPTPLRTVEVLRGDSFWSIAERELSIALGRAPTDEETSTYWRIVVELNRTRLVDPGDPSRIYAGQRVVLP